MDVSKFKPSDWMKAGGGLLFFIAFFLDWTGNDFGGLAGSHYFLTGVIPFILIVAATVVAIMLAMGKSVGKLPMPLLGLAATALATLLVVFRLLLSDSIDAGGRSFDLDRKVGLFLATIGAIVALVGWFLGFKESGGNIADLTDPNKLKASFNQPAQPQMYGQQPPQYGQQPPQYGQQPPQYGQQPPQYGQQPPQYGQAPPPPPGGYQQSPPPPPSYGQAPPPPPPGQGGYTPPPPPPPGS